MNIIPAQIVNPKIRKFLWAFREQSGLSKHPKRGSLMAIHTATQKHIFWAWKNGETKENMKGRAQQIPSA